MSKRTYTAEQLARRKEYAREHNALPEVKERKRLHALQPDVIEKRKAYHQRPDVKQRAKDRLNKESVKAYMKEWRASDATKERQRGYSLKVRGFTLELERTLLALQGNACAICRVPFTGKPRQLHADHCHELNEPRGLLCNFCNTAEGYIGKTGLTPTEFGRRLEAYLADPPASSIHKVPAAAESVNQEI